MTGGTETEGFEPEPDPQPVDWDRLNRLRGVGAVEPVQQETGSIAQDGRRAAGAGRPGARWAFLEGLDVGADGDPYLDRLRIIQTPLFGIYLHHIHRPDRDPDPHDHPWGFASLVIAGGYTEYVWPDKRDRIGYVVRERPRWSLRRLGRGAAHIITEAHGTLWTLVLTGPRRGEWGFWTTAGFVGWREYISRAGDPQ